jgi:hypothetical protein
VIIYTKTVVVLNLYNKTFKHRCVAEQRRREELKKVCFFFKSQEQDSPLNCSLGSIPVFRKRNRDQSVVALILATRGVRWRVFIVSTREQNRNQNCLLRGDSMVTCSDSKRQVG